MSDIIELTQIENQRKIAIRKEDMAGIVEARQPGSEVWGSATTVRIGGIAFTVEEDYDTVLAMLKGPETPDIYEWVADNFSVAAYAAMYDDALGFASLGAAWTPVDNYTGTDIPAKNIVPDPVAGTMLFPYEGIYQIAATINLEHDESNSGRTTYVRMFNVTDGLPGAGQLAMGIGRNQPASNLSTSFLFDVTASSVNKGFRLEIGGGDSITVIGGNISYDTHMVSEWREALPSDP